ncbi:hypothetical protein NL676_015713 [Syzygium grande]|nr:hypothetical protein NL676_015713 [Syzygium grande]
MLSTGGPFGPAIASVESSPGRSPFVVEEVPEQAWFCLWFLGRVFGSPTRPGLAWQSPGTPRRSAKHWPGEASAWCSGE